MTKCLRSERIATLDEIKEYIVYGESQTRPPFDHGILISDTTIMKVSSYHTRSGVVWIRVSISGVKISIVCKSLTNRSIENITLRCAAV